MPNRKKPIGQEWEDFKDAWNNSTHAGKLELVAKYETTYDVAKHWIMEGNTDPQEDTQIHPLRVSVEDLLDSRPAVNLDFVAFDLESSNLTADYSILLSAVIKPFGCPPIVFRGDDYDTWHTNRANDGAIVKAISEELRKHAIVVSHYGARFDIRYLRAKMFHWSLPPLPPMFGVDSWRIAKDNFQVSSRRLKNLVTYFDIGDKEPVEGALWMDAAYNGGKEAMDKIVSHNIQDCLVLEKLACIIFPLLKSIPKL